MNGYAGVRAARRAVSALRRGRESTAHPLLRFLILLALPLGAASVAAECAPPGSAKADTIICTGLDSDGLSALGGDDSVEVVSGATVERTDTIPGIYFETAVTTIDLGAGTDTLDNAGLVNLNADALALGLISVPGKADLTAVGIDGGSGRDTLSSSGQVTVDGTASTAVGGAWMGSGHVPLLTSATAAANSTGLFGADGKKTVDLLTGSTHTVGAYSNANLLDVSLTSNGLSLSMDTIWDGGSSSTATAAGMRGDAADDWLVNAGTQQVTADAQARSLAVTGVHEGLAVSVNSTTSDATATGLDGAAGEDVLKTLHSFDVTAEAETIAGSFTGFTSKKEASGVIKSFMGAHATATATGIAGAGGADTVKTAGSMSVRAESDAFGAEAKWTPESVNNPQWVGWVNSLATPWLSAGLDFVFGMQAGVDAVATAYGISAGDGADTVINRATLDVDALADAVHLKVSVDAGKLNEKLWKDVGQSLLSVLSQSAAKLLISSDAAEAPTTFAAAIDAGRGDDTINNYGAIDLLSDAMVFSTDVVLANESIDLDFLLVVFGGGLSASSEGYGIDAGSGDDHVFNHASIMLTADTTATAIGLSGTFKGIAQTTVSARADSDAFAIAGGSGVDVVHNWADLTTTAEADAVSVGAAVNAEVGAAFALDSVFDGGTTATAEATGIHGGDGDDTLYQHSGSIDVLADAHANSDKIAGALKGVAGAVMTSTATARAWGLDGGAGTDHITSDALVSVDAQSDAFSLGIALSGSGVAIAMDAVWDGGTGATSEATGIAGGGGDDTLTNSGQIHVGRQIVTDAQSRSVGISGVASFDAIGVAGAVVTSTADAFFAGIDGAAGSDLLTNSANAEILVDVTADAASTSVAFTGVGVAVAADAVWDGGTRGHAIADGLRAGSGEDWLYNHGLVDARATADSGSTGVALTGAGVAGAVVTSTATAEAFGLRGEGAADYLENRGTVKADAYSDALSVGVALSGSGVAIAMDAVWDGGTTASSTAKGLAGDDADDTLHNFGIVNAGGYFGTDAKARSVGVSGVPSLDGLNVAVAVVTSTAEAAFTAIDGGDGDDLLQHHLGGSIVVDATADAGSTSVSFTGTGVALALDAVWDGGTGASADAFALDGGDGNDILVHQGVSVSKATAVTRSTGVAVSLVGVAGAIVSSTADAHASGLFGGSGDDILGNDNQIQATADASARSTSVAVTLVGASGGFAGTEATALARGLEGGEGSDELTNAAAGTITVNSIADAKSTSVSGSIVGAAGAFAGAVAHAKPAALLGGAGDDALYNHGTLSIGSWSKVDASALSFTLVGFSSSKVAESRAEVTAFGLAGEAGDDELTNTGSISIGLADPTQPMAVAYARSASWSLIGAALSDAVLSATSRATGLGGGDGDDTLINTGTLNIGPTLDSEPMVDGDVSGASWSFAGSSTVRATAEVTADARGLSGGDGDDELYNHGDITVTGFANLIAHNGAETEFGGSSASAQATANARGFGLHGGSGDNLLVNSGSVAVTLYATNDADNSSDTGWLYGDGDTVSNADAVVSGYGLYADDGDSTVSHQQGGQIDVTVLSYSDAYAYSDGGDIWDGDASSEAKSTVTADAAGIAVGSGTLQVINAADIDVLLTTRAGDEAMAYAYAYADGDGLDGDGWGRATATVDAYAAGIRVGDGDQLVGNSAVITVTAQPKAYARVNIDGDNTGNATGNTYSTATADAVGIALGNGDSEVGNSGELVVTAAPRADVRRSVDEGWLGDARGSNHATAGATATGIRAGDGKLWIDNSGVITVSASALSNYASASLSQAAIGITTGSGNDRIDNRGTIDTHVGGVSGAGTAINSGAGDDTVRLFAASVTNGDIDLGDGDDRLHLLGGLSLSGDLVGGDGRDDIVLDGAGSLGADLYGFERLVKDGEGSFVVSNPVNGIDDLTINAGSLQMTQPYVFPAGGLYSATVYGDGSAGAFQAATAELHGALNVTRGAGRYLDGSRFDVVVSAGLSGQFDSVSLPTVTPLLAFNVAQSPAAVQVVAHAQPYASVAANPTAGVMGRYLDAIAPAASGDLASVIGEIQALADAASASAALQSLSPETYDGISQLSLLGSRARARQLSQRMGVLRAGGDVAATTRLTFEPLLLAYGGQSFSDLLNAARQPSRSQGIWVEAFGRIGDAEADNSGFSGFDYRMAGLTLGYDRLLDEHWIVGAALGYARTDADFAFNRANTDIDSTMLSVYGGWHDTDAYVEGTLSIGHNDYSQQRTVNIGGFDRVASSHHDGDVIAASLGGGLIREQGPWQSGPYTALHYARVIEDGFTETGAGGINLQLAPRTTNSLATELGVRARHSRDWHKGKLNTELSAAWLHDLDIDDRTVTGSFTGSPGSRFALPGKDVERNGVGYGVGVSYFADDGVIATLRYRGETRDGYQDHALVGEIRMEFD